MREKFQELRERFNSQSGFTLIELMATLAILALIVVIAVPAIGNIITSAGQSSYDTTVDMIERSAEIAYVESIKSDGSGTGTFTVGELISEGFLDLELSEGATGTYSAGEGTLDHLDTVVKATDNGADFVFTPVPDLP